MSAALALVLSREKAIRDENSRREFARKRIEEDRKEYEEYLKGVAKIPPS